MKFYSVQACVKPPMKNIMVTSKKKMPFSTYMQSDLCKELVLIRSAAREQGASDTGSYNQGCYFWRSSTGSSGTDMSVTLEN